MIRVPRKVDIEKIEVVFVISRRPKSFVVVIVVIAEFCVSVQCLFCRRASARSIKSFVVCRKRSARW